MPRVVCDDLTAGAHLLFGNFPVGPPDDDGIARRGSEHLDCAVLRQIAGAGMDFADGPEFAVVLDAKLCAKTVRIGRKSLEPYTQPRRGAFVMEQFCGA